MPESSKTMYLAILIIVAIAVFMTFISVSSTNPGGYFAATASSSPVNSDLPCDATKGIIVLRNLTNCSDNGTVISISPSPTGRENESGPKYNCYNNYAFKFSCGLIGSEKILVADFAECPNGCSNGACITAATCTDSDGGKDYYTRGINKFDGSSAIEICVGDDGKPTTGEEGTQVTETWCENNERKTQIYPCPYGCSNGACKLADWSLSENKISCSGTACPTWNDSIGAYTFDGRNDRFTNGTAIPSNINNLNKAFTISAWINPDNVSGARTYRAIVYKGESTKETNLMLFGDELYADVDGRGYITTTGQDIPVGRWNHIALTWDGSRLRMYRNRTLVGTSAATTFPSGGAGSLFVGSYRGTQYYFSGAIGDVTVFNRTLTAGEIKSLYDASAGKYLTPTTTFTYSDGGKDYYVKGIATGIFGSDQGKFPDSCCLVEGAQSYCYKTEGEAVLETYCDSQYIRTEQKYCLLGCSNGACVKTCTDSDGGKNYFIKGYVAALNGNPDTCSVPYTPDCLRGGGVYKGMCDVGECSGNDCYVAEALCGDNLMYFPDLYKCPNGCSNGACLTTTCTDSDGGLNYYHKGSVGGETDTCFLQSDARNIFQDKIFECSGNKDCGLVERYCSDEGYDTNIIVFCPYGCRDGACINENSENITGDCVDPDVGGTDVYSKSKVIYRTGDGQLIAQLDDCCDHCLTAGSLKGEFVSEYTCDATNKAKRNIIKCPNGCSNGACLTTPAGTGRIEIVSNPSNASIYACTNESSGYSCGYAGQTPLNSSGSTPVSFNITITKEGYQNYTEFVTITGNDSVKVVC